MAEEPENPVVGADGAEQRSDYRAGYEAGWRDGSRDAEAGAERRLRARLLSGTDVAAALRFARDLLDGASDDEIDDEILPVLAASIARNQRN